MTHATTTLLFTNPYHTFVADQASSDTSDSDVLAGGGVDSGETTESEVLGLLVLVGEALDSLLGVVNVLGHVDGRDEETSLGLVGSSLLGTVSLLVLGDEGDGSLEFLFGVLL